MSDPTSAGQSAPQTPEMVLVAAVAENGVIAHEGAIPWRLPTDQQHFRRTTMGHAMLMGRTTYDEMGALPGRTSIVLTRDTSYRAGAGVRVVHDLDAALAVSAEEHPGQPLMVVGGAQVYGLALERGARHQVLSEVHAAPEGDTFYPEFDRSAWVEERREEHDGFTIVWWVRR